MAEAFLDHYSRLELPPFASVEEIRKAWKRLARREHPDRNPGDPAAEERFKLLHESYQLLSNPQQREQYDQLYSRRTGRARPSDSQSRAQDTPPPRKKTQKTASSTSNGKTRQEEREARKGARQENRTPPPRSRPGPDQRRVIRLPLSRFDGGGSVRISFQDGRPELEFRLPEKLAAGEELVLPGKGGPGRNGGPRGRLILEIQPELPPEVEREGLDLKIQVPMDVLDLMLGAECELAHPDGRLLKVNLPAGAQPGQCIRLKRQGLPGIKDRGDLLLQVEARLRKARSPRSRKLTEKLARLLKKEEERG